MRNMGLILISSFFFLKRWLNKEDSELIKFKELPEVPVALCVNHYGAYEHMQKLSPSFFAYAGQMDTRSLTVPVLPY